MGLHCPVWRVQVHANGASIRPFGLSHEPALSEWHPNGKQILCLITAFCYILDYLDLEKNNTLFPTNYPITPKVDKEKSWLYTLDPILVTIITMSSVGVLLGAICAGLLLYCTCSYAGLSSRSSTTLENYNFELYDGIKHKVKMNHQKCCSEA